MTRSDDSRSSGGSATDPLIPAHPDRVQSIESGNAPFAPRPSRSLAPSSTFPPATTTSTPPRPRVPPTPRRSYPSPRALRQFQLGYGSTPASSRRRGARPGRRRARRVAPSRSTDSMEPPRDRPPPREEHARCPRRSTRDERSDERDGRDVGVRRGHGREAFDGEIGGEHETSRATSPRANRRREVAAHASGARRLARTQSIEDQKTQLDGEGVPQVRRGRVGSIVRGGRRRWWGGRGGRRGGVPGGGFAGVDAVVDAGARGALARFRDGEGEEGLHGVVDGSTALDVDVLEDFAGEGVAEHLKDLGRARERAGSRGGCGGGVPTAGCVARRGRRGGWAVAKRERGASRASARARAADGVAVESGVESVQAVDARTVALPSAPPGRAGLFFPPLPPRTPPELGPAPSSSSSLDQSSQSCLPFFPLRGILARDEGRRRVTTRPVPRLYFKRATRRVGDGRG